jgi:hypothetical protein
MKENRETEEFESPGCPGTLFVDQSGLNLRDLYFLSAGIKGVKHHVWLRKAFYMVMRYTKMTIRSVQKKESNA